MNDKESKEIRERHSRQFGRPRCEYCLDPFPCEVIRLLDENEKLTNELRKLKEVVL